MADYRGAIRSIKWTKGRRLSLSLISLMDPILSMYSFVSLRFVVTAMNPQNIRSSVHLHFLLLFLSYLFFFLRSLLFSSGFLKLQWRWRWWMISRTAQKWEWLSLWLLLMELNFCPFESSRYLQDCTRLLSGVKTSSWALSNSPAKLQFTLKRFYSSDLLPL